MILKKHNYAYILSFILILLIIIINLSIITKADTMEYKVYDLTLNEGKRDIEFGEILFSTDDFNEAREKMLRLENGVITHDSNPSPLKIVAASRSQAQSFPYRKGKNAAGATLSIFKNRDLSDSHTYIPAHYMMYVYDYIYSNGRIVADIEIQGGKGYVEIVKTDIIPMIYIENEIGIELGGQGTYNENSKTSYKIKPVQETYIVEDRNGFNELRVYLKRPYPGLADVNLTYGIVPDDIPPGIYYSSDGIRFFTHRELKEESRVGGDYYAYFQWLPLRSKSNHDAQAMENFLMDIGIEKDKSVMVGETYHFIEQAEIYGMNPVLVFQQANLESGYGRSKYAVERNNLFGWGAVDSNPNQAYTYDDIGQGIGIHLKRQIAGYMNAEDWRHHGPAFGNKSAGITVRYASDPYYGIKIASLYYRLDRLNGFKDHNYYEFALLEDGTTYSVMDYDSEEGWYDTRPGLENQIIIKLERQGGKIKTIPMMSKYLEKDHELEGQLDLDDEFAYIDDSDGTILDIAKNGVKKEPKYGDPVNARTTDNLNLRRVYSTQSAIIARIPKGTKLIVEPSDIGWAKTKYDGKTGFVSMEYLEILEGGELDIAEANAKISKALGTSVKDDIMTGLNLGNKLSKVSESIMELDTKAKIILRDKEDKEKAKDSVLATGDKLEVILGSGDSLVYSIAVKGDINGDSKINSSDYIQIANHILGKKILKGSELVAMDINDSDSINSADYVAIANHILGKKLIH